MSVAVPVFVSVPFSVRVIVVVIVVVLAVGVLIVGAGVDMSMAVIMNITLARIRRISARFGIERPRFLRHDQVHLAQHAGQHVVWLELQMIRLEFKLHMSVAEVVSRAHQVERRSVLGALAHHEHRLRCGDDPDQ